MPRHRRPPKTVGDQLVELAVWLMGIAVLSGVVYFVCIQL